MRSLSFHGTIVDGSSKIAAHAYSEIGHWHLFRTRAVSNLKFILEKKSVFPYDSCSEFLYNDISAMTPKLGTMQTKSLKKGYNLNLIYHSLLNNTSD